MLIALLILGSEILIVISGVIALVALAASFYLIFPIFLNIQTNPSPDCAASASCMAIFDRLYDVMFVIFAVFTGGIFLAMYMRALRKDSTVSYSSGGGGFEDF